MNDENLIRKGVIDEKFVSHAVCGGTVGGPVTLISRD